MSGPAIAGPVGAHPGEQGVERIGPLALIGISLRQQAREIILECTLDGSSLRLAGARGRFPGQPAYPLVLDIQPHG